MLWRKEGASEQALNAHVGGPRRRRSGDTAQKNEDDSYNAKHSIITPVLFDLAVTLLNPLTIVPRFSVWTLGMGRGERRKRMRERRKERMQMQKTLGPDILLGRR